MSLEKKLNFDLPIQKKSGAKPKQYILLGSYYTYWSYFTYWLIFFLIESIILLDDLNKNPSYWFSYYYTTLPIICTGWKISLHLQKYILVDLKNIGRRVLCLIEPYIFCKFQTWKSRLAAEELDMSLIMNVFNTLPILTW